MPDGINTYPEMNEKIVGILRINPEDKSGMYAAARIEELESALAASKKREEDLREENIKLIKEMGKGFRAIEIPLRKCIEAKDAEIAGLRAVINEISKGRTKLRKLFIENPPAKQTDGRGE